MHKEYNKTHAVNIDKIYTIEAVPSRHSLIHYISRRSPKQPLAKSCFQKDRKNPTIDTFPFLSIAAINEERKRIPVCPTVCRIFSLSYATSPNANSISHFFNESSNSSAIPSSFRFAVFNIMRENDSPVVQRWSLYPLNQWYRVDTPHFACES
jgi:hypothetical protein